MKELLLVGIGGFFGSIARFLVSKLDIYFGVFTLPVSTLIVNIVGSLLIGVFSGIFIHTELMHNNLRLLLITGFCGGFTTFSAFAFENMTMIQNGQLLQLAIYIITSIVLSMVAIFLGYFMVQHLICN